MRKLADCHIHIRNSRFDEIEKMLDDIHSVGVTDACLQALPYRSTAENISALYWKENYKKMTMTAFGGIHITDRYSIIPYEKQAEKLLDLGCDGIKLIDMHPELREYITVSIDDVKYDKMLSLLEERDKPLLIHLAGPKECWLGKDENDKSPNSIYRGACPDAKLGFDDYINEGIRMLKKHPKLKVVFAHFMFLASDYDRAVEIMETYPNVYFDITPGTDMYYHFSVNTKLWHDFFEKYSNRILFGTDVNTYKDFNKELVEYVRLLITEKGEYQTHCYGNHKYKGLYLSDDALNNICYNNFYNLINNKIEKVDMNEVYNCAEWVYNDIKKNPEDIIYQHYFDDTQVLQDREQEAAKIFFEKLLENR